MKPSSPFIFYQKLSEVIFNVSLYSVSVSLCPPSSLGPTSNQKMCFTRGAALFQTSEDISFFLVKVLKVHPVWADF